MPLSSITTTVKQGGVGRRSASKDGVSGLLWWSDTLPAGFDSISRVKRVLTLADAEALGILSTVSAVSVLHYHISEFFRMNPNGELWVGVYPVPGGSYTFAEIAPMYAVAQGEIRNLMIYANLLTYTSTQVTTIQSIITAQDALGFRSSVLYCPNFAANTDFTAATDIRTLNAPKVTVVVCQDGGGDGAALFTLKSFSISCGGALLGALSRAGVQESIGNPGNYNFSDGNELETLAMCSGALLSTISAALLGSLKDKGYAVMRKYTPRLAGSYSERLPTAVAISNDYNFVELNRTIDKAIRLVESALTPYLQSGIKTNSDGTLTDDIIGFFQDKVGQQLSAMMAAGEISGNASDLKNMVLIDPNQDVVSTSTLNITIKIIPVGIAEFITIQIGLTTSL